MNNQRHLTDSEFTDLLLGSISPEVATHLESCALCADEARNVSGAILSFDRESRAWAERHAATLPALSAPARPGASWLGVPAVSWAWQAAVALTLACAGVIGYQVQHRADQPVAVASVSSMPASPAVSPARIQADNDLLSAIDGELQAEAAPPASVYGLDVAVHPSQARRGKRITN